MSVDVTRKKISRRNTMSVIEDIDIFGSAFVVLLSAIVYIVSSSEAGSLRRSINSIVVLSILNTTSDTFAERKL